MWLDTNGTKQKTHQFGMVSPAYTNCGRSKSDKLREEIVEKVWGKFKRCHIGGDKYQLSNILDQDQKVHAHIITIKMKTGTILGGF